jgi:uncharacterized lipoprotein YmbA
MSFTMKKQHAGSDGGEYRVAAKSLQEWAAQQGSVTEALASHLTSDVREAGVPPKAESPTQPRMTVQDLISKLQAYPNQDATIVIVECCEDDAGGNGGIATFRAIHVHAPEDGWFDNEPGDCFIMEVSASEGG